MKRLLLFCASAGLLLGSAAPPPLLRYDPSVFDEPIGTCADPASCATFAAAVPQDGAVEAEPPTLLYDVPLQEPAPLAEVAAQKAEAAPVPAAPARAVALAAAPADAALAEDEAAPVEQAADAAPAKAASPRSGVRVVVSIPAQKAYVFKDGELVDTAPVSTGRKGHSTPTGTFPILQKKVHHRSNKYSNAPMPYMQRLTWSGVAMHAGPLPGYPASHGCIRLPRSFAKKLYNLTDHGTLVTVTSERPKSAEDALELA